MSHSQWIRDKHSERHAPSLLITSNSTEYPALADFEAINEVPQASRIGNQATNYLESHASRIVLHFRRPSYVVRATGMTISSWFVVRLARYGISTRGERYFDQREYSQQFAE